MESLERLGARVFWTNAGHMLADGLTKLSDKAELETLMIFLESGRIRITYCEGSWKKELASSRRGELRELPVLGSSTWNHPHETYSDTPGHSMHS